MNTPFFHHLAIVDQPPRIVCLRRFPLQHVEIPTHLAHAAEDAAVLADEVEGVAVFDHLALVEHEDLVVIDDSLRKELGQQNKLSRPSKGAGDLGGC